MVGVVDRGERGVCDPIGWIVVFRQRLGVIVCNAYWSGALQELLPWFVESGHIGEMGIRPKWRDLVRSAHLALQSAVESRMYHIDCIGTLPSLGIHPSFLVLSSFAARTSTASSADIVQAIYTIGSYLTTSLDHSDDIRKFRQATRFQQRGNFAIFVHFHFSLKFLMELSMILPRSCLLTTKGQYVDLHGPAFS